jgi:hypothetical protein
VKPERVGQLVACWVRFYTRGLSTPIAERRIAEIDADLHEHIAHERASSMSDRRIAVAVASRMLRGLAADLAWRRGRLSTQEETMKASKTLYRSAVRVALGVGLILSLPLVAMQFTDEIVWSAADFRLAGALLTVLGVAVELAVRKAGNLAVAIGVAALGVAAGSLGKVDDAPGLVLLGILLLAGGCAIGVRRAQHRT